MNPESNLFILLMRRKPRGGQGLPAITQQALAGLGVKPIETEGKDFDVDLHEAVAQVPGVPDEQKGRVIDCIEKGYTLNDHVIRHAKVAVGM